MRWIVKFKREVKHVNRVAITCHKNADPDAICSAIVLRQLLKKINQKLKIYFIFPEGVNEASQRILEFSRLTSSIGKNITRVLDDVEILFIVDASTLSVLGSLKKQVEGYKGKIVIIDHHKPSKKLASVSYLLNIDEKSTSTVELIYELFQRTRIPITKRIAQIMLTGIMFDSGYFSIVNSTTFKTAAVLIETGARIGDSRSLLLTPINRSEKIARIKAAQRSTIKHVNNWIFVASEIDSYQASAARMLISLGADISMVQGGSKGYFRVNFRASSNFSDKTGFHLGNDLAQPIGEFLKGEGGGHDRAAGINVKGDKIPLEKVTKKAVELLKQRLRK